jgi:O-succinylbenzoic acid--CoA ligase
MDKSSQRDLLHVPQEWSIAQQRQALEAALRGDGPALTWNASDLTHVPAECAVVVATSGSTGNPKYVALPATALIASARASHSYLQAEAGDRWSLLLPTTHIAGINVLVRSIELGSEIVSVDSTADFTAIVPTQLHRALNGDAALLAHLKSAKAVLVGGAATSAALRTSASSAGINLVTTYGMSEMSGGCVYNGTPLVGVDIRIVEGRIELNGPMKAIGYLGNEPFGDKYFITQDAGAMIDGHLVVTGRIDDQIVTGGEKLSLGAVSDFLDGISEANGSAQRYIAVGLPDAEWGQALAIASDGLIDEVMVREQLRSQFGNHASPKRFLSNIELPLTSIAKPDRAKLVQIFGRLA